MSIQTAMCVSFKREIMEGVHDLLLDTIMYALFQNTGASVFGPETTVYDGSREVSSSAHPSYIAGGIELTGKALVTDGNSAIFTFNNPVFPAATLTAWGALIYNASQNDRAICVIAFDRPHTGNGGDFIVDEPAANSSTSTVRID